MTLVLGKEVKMANTYMYLNNHYQKAVQKKWSGHGQTSLTGSHGLVLVGIKKKKKERLLTLFNGKVQIIGGARSFLKKYSMLDAAQPDIWAHLSSNPLDSTQVMLLNQ